MDMGYKEEDSLLTCEKWSICELCLLSLEKTRAGGGGDLLQTGCCHSHVRFAQSEVVPLGYHAACSGC